MDDLCGRKPYLPDEQADFTDVIDTVDPSSEQNRGPHKSKAGSEFRNDSTVADTLAIAVPSCSRTGAGARWRNDKFLAPRETGGRNPFSERSVYPSTGAMPTGFHWAATESETLQIRIV